MSSDTPLPSPPFITVPGVPNFRDIGGYKVTTTITPSNITNSEITDDSQNGGAAGAARSVRRGFVYRAADPGKASEGGKQRLKELGIKKIFDLRSMPELAKLEEPLLEIEGIERVFSPVFVEEDYSPEGVAVRYKNYTIGPEGFVAAYKDILEAASTPRPATSSAPAHKAAYITIFKHILDHPDQPFLIHCTAGKDRTGVLCALFLTLASADPEVIATEYSLTARGLSHLAPLFIERLSASSALGGDRKKAEIMVSSHVDSMRGMLEMLNETFGGAEGYLMKECGFSADEVNKIKKALVSADDPIL